VKIYTKTGDGGETSLLGGARVPKDHLRVAACGDVEETNAALGAVRGHADDELAGLLLAIQKDLFAIGAWLADPGAGVAAQSAKAAVTEAQVQALETAIDAREAALPKLRSFLLPGGCPAARLLHQARTVCRRAERSVVSLAHAAAIDPLILAYLNRLSDLLFVLARHENQRAGIAETPW
jgi:cob(I)alamin adenosyltransferase